MHRSFASLRMTRASWIRDEHEAPLRRGFFVGPDSDFTTEGTEEHRE